jgi:Protein of unknown function (DUF3224)
MAAANYLNLRLILTGALISRLRLLLVPLVALLAMTGATVAAASPRATASGTFTYTSCIPNSVQVVGGNTIIDFTCTVAYTGTLSGTSTLRGPLTIHADGSTSFHGSETFTGTVRGASGTVTFNGVSLGTATSFHERNVIVIGTGALADLHGIVRLVGTVPAPPGIPYGTYTGRLRFDDD